MPKKFTQEEKQHFQSYLKVQLKDEHLSLSPDEKITLLEQKNRKQSWILAFNVVFILLFGYSFYAGITQLSDTILYILLAVFVINLGLIFYQKKRIGELIDYLKWKRNHNF